LERRYLTVFIAILVVSLLLGVVWNAVLDISNRSRAADTLRQAFDVVKANDAEKFARMTKIASSLIYQDYDENILEDRLKSATDIYATFRSMAELKSVSLIKLIDRITCLAAVTFRGNDGKDITHYMLVVNHEDREGNLNWVPFSILRIKAGRNSQVENLPKLIDEKNAREKAKEAAEGAVASYANQVESQIAGILAKLENPDEIRNKLVELLVETRDLVEIPELVEKVSPEEAVDAAHQKTTELIEKLRLIASKVESVEVAGTIHKLAKLSKEAGNSFRSTPKKRKEKPEKSEIEKLVEKFVELPDKVKSPEIADEIRGMLGHIGEEDRIFQEKLKALAEKVESPELAAQVAKLEKMVFTKKTELPGALGAVAGMLAAEEHAGRLKDTGLVVEVKAAKKLAEAKEMNPLAGFGSIGSPKNRYLRFVARLKAIGNAKEPEKEKAKVLVIPGRISGGLKQAGELIKKLTTPFSYRYKEAAEALAEIAPSDELKREANELVKAAGNAINDPPQADNLPDMQGLADRIKAVLLEDDKVRQEKFKALAKLARKSLQDAGPRTSFANECEAAADKPESGIDKYIERYAELALKPVELEAPLAGMLPGLITNSDTLKVWKNLFKTSTGNLDLSQIVQGVTADALDASDLYEARGAALRSALRVEKNRRGSIEAKMRKRIETLTASFPAEWAGMKETKEYTKWAFPGGKPSPETSGLSKSRIDRLLKRQEKFAKSVVGKKVATIITHHWYPDPEDGFQKTDTRRLSEIVRVRFQTNPDAEKGSEEYTINDFMLLLKMAPDWSVKWKLHRTCNLKEYAKCSEIAQEEFESRKVYFADGKAR
jgi:hypothetical protein